MLCIGKCRVETFYGSRSPLFEIILPKQVIGDDEVARLKSILRAIAVEDIVYPAYDFYAGQFAVRYLHCREIALLARRVYACRIVRVAFGQ